MKDKGESKLEKIDATPICLTASDIGVDLAQKHALLAFRKEWLDLPIDPYLEAHENYRKRKHCKFKYSRSAELLERLPDGEYFQSSKHNPLFGGLKRLFEPAALEFTNNNILRLLLSFNCTNVPIDSDNLLVHCHLVRIEASLNSAGKPAPEGVHRDGFQYVSIHLIERYKCIGGETIIMNNSNQVVYKNSLINPFDSLYLNDQNFLHYTSAIEVETNEKVGFRDVLLCSYEEF